MAAALAASIVLVVQRVTPHPDGTPTADTAVAPERRVPTADGRAAVSAGGVGVVLAGGAATVRLDDATFGLRTVRVGEAIPRSPVTIQEDGRAVHAWGRVDEWYRERTGAVEHGYTVHTPVSGDELVAEVAVTGARPVPVDARSAALVLADGSLATYRDLLAFDASGRDLAATMSVVGESIRLNVDVSNADYPVTIDPIISEDQTLRGTFAGEELGTAIDVDGNRMAVGVPGALTIDGAGSGTNTNGIVRMYARDAPDAPWVADGILVNPSPSYSEFGRSVSVRGDQVAVGAPGFAVGPIPDQGVVLLFENNGVTWLSAGEFGAGGAGSYGFGWSVDHIADDRLVIGAPGFVEGVGDLAPGQVFEYDGGVVTAIPVGATTGTGDEMGYAVAADVRPGGGVRIVVGAPGDETDNGLVRVLDDTGTGWTIRTGRSGGVGARLGSAVDVSGNRIAYDSASDVSVLVTVDGGTTWSNDLITSVLRGSFGGTFNRHFDLEGGTLAVGAPVSNEVQIFRYDGGTWGGAVLATGADTLRPTGAAGDDRAGFAIALDGTTLAVGAPGDDGIGDATPESGAVFTREVPLIANFTFASGGFGAWGDPANWDVGVAPGPDDRAIVPAGTFASADDLRTVDRLFLGGQLSIPGRLTVASASQIASSGVVFVEAAGRLDLPRQLVLDGQLVTRENGQVVALGETELIGSGLVANSGEISKEGPGVLTTGAGLAWNSGTNSLLAAAEGDVVVQGSYDARGTTAAKAGNVVDLAGDLIVVSTSTVEIEISGPSTDPANHGRIRVGGSLLFDGSPVGTLRAVQSGYTPDVGDSYPIISCGVDCVGGRFATVDAGALEPVVTATEVRLTIPSPTSLDFDLEVQVGSESVEVATGISIADLDVATTTAATGSTLAASSLAAIGADDPAATPLTAITVGSTPLTAIVLDSEVLSAIPLVNIDIDGGWVQIIEGSELENEPLASLTFGQVLSAGSPTDPTTPAGRVAAAPLTAIEVDGTPLTAITIGAIALGTTPLTAIPLTAIDPALDWCDIVADLVPSGTTCDDAFLGTLTVLEATLRGVPLTAIPLEQLPLTAIDPQESPLTAIPLTAIDLFQTPLTAIPLAAIPLTAIDVADAPLTAIPLTAIPASAIPLTAIPLTAIDVLGSPLTAIRADATPLTAIDPTGAPPTAIGVEGAPLTAIPLTAIAVMDTPLTAIPLTAIGDPATEWCALLDDADIDASCDTNVDPATTTLRELFVRGLPLTAIDFAAIPLTAIDVNGLPLTAIGLEDAPLTAIPIALPLTAIETVTVTFDDGTGPAATPLTAIPLTAIDLVGSGLADTPLTAIDAAALPLTAIDAAALPLTAIPVSGAPLTAIVVDGTPLTAIEVAPADLAGSPLTAIELADIPLTAIDCSLVDCDGGTVGDAIEAGAVLPGLTLGDLQAGAAGIRLADLVDVVPGLTGADLSAALAGLTLDDWTDLDDLTLGDLPDALIDGFALDLEDLGDALSRITFGDLVGNVRDPATGEPLPGLEAELRAAIDALGLDLGDLTSLDDVTLGDLLDGYLGTPLTLADIPTVLGFLTVADLESLLGVTFDLTGLTLGDLTPEELGALTLGDLVDLLIALDLGDLLAAIEGELGNYSLGDLLLALVDPGSLALGGVDFVDVESLQLPDGTVPASTFQATFELGGSTTRSVGIELVLPPSANYVPGTGSLSVDTGGGPTLVEQRDPTVAGDRLGLVVAATPGATYTYEFEVLPSLRLGATNIGASARVAGTGLSINASASVDVQEGAEPNDFPETVAASEDVVYLTYISTPTDNDVYEITVGEDDELAAQLSNLSADLDLVLWGDPVDDGQDAPLADTSDAPPIIPITDPDADGADAEPLDDFARLDELPGGERLGLVAVSNRPGTEDELIRTGRLPAGTYYLQVYGSNGATSLRPGAFQVAVIEADTKPECVAVDLPPLGAPGAAPAVGADADTLILVNESRLEQYHGAQARQDVVDAIARLEAELAGDPSIDPVTISVDGVPSVAAAYAAWDADPCNPNAANAVVAAVNADVIDPVRDQLEHVVILGGDEMIPMARLTDATEIANEYDYRYEFQGDLAGPNPDGRNSLTSAQWETTILSDDPYGDGDARSLGDRFLYVTDLALGRVVETPADIVDALDTFVEFDGTLAIDTAAVLGYDFLVDGSEAVAADLAQAVPTDDELADGLDAGGQPWDRADATDALDTARQNALISLNAHFDHYRALPAIGDKVPGFSDLLVAEDVAAELGPEALLRSLIFSAGCHSGLAVSDVLITTTSTDWAEIFGQQGALFVGNTGFGYGDTEAVAYTELLMERFAERVTVPFDLGQAGSPASSTVGQALAWAKNDYIGGLQSLSVYDEKAVMESTFYGLPFYRVGLPSQPLPAPPANVPVAGELDVVVDATNDATTTPTGTYYSNLGPDGEQLTIVAPGRPIQPKQVTDISVVGADPTELATIARGAIVESMTSRYVSLPDPVVATPIFDEANGQPEPDLQPGAFPAKPLTITSSRRPEGRRQALVVATGQYRAGPDVQRLDDDIDVTVYYADAAQTDFTPPRIGAVESRIVGGDLEIRLVASDGPASGNTVDRVHVLVAFDPGAGTVQWTGLDLAPGAGPDEWSGSIPVPPGASGAELVVSAKDTVGNVGYATNKAFQFGEVVDAPPPPAPSDLDVAVSGAAGSGGWFDGPVTITVSGANGPFTFFVDGVPGGSTLADGGSFVIGAGGTSRWRVVDADGAVRSGTVRVDDDGAPDITVASPADGASFVSGSGVRFDVTCADVSLDTCRRLVRRTDVGSSTPQLVPPGSLLPTAPGAYELLVRATDRAGNVATPITTTFTITPLVGPPEIREITGPMTPQSVTEPVAVEAQFADVTGTFDDYTATFDWGDGTVEDVAVAPADEPTATTLGRVGATRTYTEPGVYTVTVTVRDDASGEDTATFDFVVLFDEGSSVTGRGFYWSGPEAYVDSPRWGSPAFFGYRAFYEDGATEPSGRTKLFLVGRFFFASTSYDYLIVNDAMAVAEGVGRIGTTEYRFRVQGVDDAGTDFFQISIWDETSGDVLYDNGVLYEDGDLVLLGGLRIRP